MTILTPTTEADLSEAVAAAAADRAPLEIAGGGTRMALGRPVQAERTLSTAGLSGITLYEPGALTLVAQAGTPMSEIDAALAAENQMLPFEPMDHRSLLGTGGEPTIGGVVATGTSGPRRLQRGACRDAMIGVRLVDGEGTAVSNGGRVMKNVTGYDLVKLMAGSWGTLGVLSEISFKLLPAPAAEVTLVIEGLDAASGVEALAEVLATPQEVTAAAHADPGVLGDASQTLVRIEGLEGSVAYRSTQIIASGDWSVREVEASRDIWRQIRDVTPFGGQPGDVWRVSLKPTDGPVLAGELREQGIAATVLYDWAGGLVWLLVPDDNAAIANAVRESTKRLGGHATLIRAPASVRAAISVFEPENPVIEHLSHGLRAKFDPHGILNPGRMRA
ncbi:MAG: glycolate oxidase subunit GlcE [Pseudomonadota bacterium]